MERCPLASEDDFPAAEADSGRTVNSVELSADGAPTAGDSAQPAGDSAQRADDSRRTLDSVELSREGLLPGAVSSGETGGSPSGDEQSSKTLEYESAEAPAPRPADLTDRTLEFDASGTGLPGGVSGQTLRSGELDDHEVARHVTAVWGDDLRDAAPRMTIKGRGLKPASPTTSLIINSRGMRRTTPAEPPKAGVDYDLLEVLGEGGMGVVFSARQASIDRQVAIKMLKTATAADERQRQKFLSEAVITGDLDHPNIVPIYELGSNRDGDLFYSMKRVHGTPWDARLRELPLDQNLGILLRVADAVAFAHSRGVIHRDLKPENVMLGDFGEVLVMDWGLAIPTAEFRKSRSVGHAGTMGGTPAYMAPEMACGPFQQISYASDIYLLGAILYEIVTGEPPHGGADVMKCLAAALRNQILPTEKKGELVDIALRAMATQPQHRYRSVQEFQDAIREYLSHSESIVLAAGAEDQLAKARSGGQYQDYAQAMYAFQEAIRLWNRNQRARIGLDAAASAYAACALQRGDYDLGLSLLDPPRPEHQELYDRLQRARLERAARQRRLRAAKRAVVALVALVLLVVTAGLWAVNRERNEALAAKQSADDQRQIAVQAERDQRLATEVALAAQRDEAKAREAAETAQRSAEKAREDERKAKLAALDSQQQEREAKLAAVEARELEAQAKAQAEYQAYIALIGLAAAKIEENAFGAARELLAQCDPRLQNWEWGRLKFLCEQASRTLDAGGSMEAVAMAPDGTQLAAAGSGGLVKIFDRVSGLPLRVLAHAPGSTVYDLDFSPDGRWIATGSSDRDGGWLRLWDAQTGAAVRVFAGHQDAVLSVRFSRDGRWLLSGSYDKTARLWDVASGSSVQTFAGHDWWVWSARFSPDSQRVVTASHDGTVLVWSVASGQPLAPPFMGHRRGDRQAPVYVADFAPDGRRIASGGLDNRILLWNPDDIQAFDYQAVIQGQPLPEQHFLELAGHRAAIRSIAFSSDGQLILSGSQDNTLNLWEADSGQLIKTLRGHDGWVRGCCFTDSDRVAVSASHDGSLRFWDIEGDREARVLRAHVLDRHSDAVLAAAFSRDGRRVVTASRDRSARIWEVATGNQQQVFREGHEFTTSTAAFFPGGQRLLTAAVDNTARIWDLATGSERSQPRMSGTGVHGAAAVSRDGRWILTGGDRQDGAAGAWNAKLWEADTGRLVHRLAAHDAEVTAVAISADSRWLFSGDRQGRCILWDRESGTALQQFSDDDQILAAVFLPGNQRLLTASSYQSVRQWQLPSAEEIPDLRLAHPDTVVGLAVSGDGRRALTSCADGVVRLWDVERAQLIRGLEMTAGRGAFAENLRRSLNETGWDERQLAAASGVELRHIETLLTAQQEAPLDVAQRLAQALEIGPRELYKVVVAVALSPDGTMGLTVAAEDRVVRLWDLAEGREILYPVSSDRLGPFLDLSGGRRGLVWGAAFSPLGQQVVTVGGDSARLWDLRRDVPADQRELMVFSPHGSVAWADISPDGQHVVTGSWDRSARVWDADTAVTVCKLGRGLDRPEDEHQGRVNCARFSPDGQMVLTASDDGTAKLWSRGDWRLVRTLRGHAGPVLHAVFSHDGSRIATASTDTTARVWDATTGRLLQTLAGHARPVRQAAFSAAGDRLLTGGEDDMALVWHITSGNPKVLNRLQAHTAAVTSVAFSPDSTSSRILTGSEDYTAILWDASTGREILTLKGHRQEVTSVAFSPDGKLALTGSQDGTAIIWLTSDWRKPAEIETAEAAAEQLEPLR